MTKQRLAGWGRVPVSIADVAPVTSPGEIHLTGLGRGGLARGLGRSYGDCAQNSGGRIFDMTPSRPVELDTVTGIAHVGAGASLGDILTACVPHGWFLPVIPGTKHITVGGAIAADVHGKNHHRDGAFGAHITQFEMITGDGSTMTIRPGSDEFRATVGGLGLTGVVMSATIQMIPIESPKLVVDTQRTSDLDEMMAAMESGDDAYRYSVAWIDLMASGASTGRGILTRGDHAPADVLESTAALSPLAYRPGKAVTVPDVFPSGLLNRLSIRAFNELWYRKAPASRIGEVQSIDEFFYPLDMLNDWNRLYGGHGFLQYQFAVPESAAATVTTIVNILSQRRYPTFLAVLKRFGPGTGLLSFPIGGWTLALDIPIGVPDLAATLAGFDELVATAGGRVYLAKDSRLRPDTFRAMYPEYGQWAGIRDRLDPQGIWRSDLARRLEMI